ncbi:hypothetical protein PNH38_17460 [Anoxybacillus rupiensis]|uniref:Modification methylase n=1 Tax=Anoxybacteroides rupiense TaxID=311460 RepID=A0ABD5J1I6_9BACL|nr:MULTISPECIES: hypothetical protein [Anoxybacillus]MBS2773169.1 hypothetical protein [Anoxybacillus rupiensis]MDE8565630.1 hypothetical protein [Anoxybacillus rupiensis]MED5053734.1 hypothetical protein [Anoxybacillus rupiensis]QHC02742.1 hypothetical protein GRQ40_01095 [Anoxybacillus sp. PDR2]
MYQKIIEIYEAIEKKFHVKHNTSLSSLIVTPSDNKESPIHNWYNFKEGYSKNILENVLQFSNIKEPIHLLDPFCGSGTTILSSMIDVENWDIKSAIGIEVNPFIHFIAQTKSNFHHIDSGIVYNFINFLKKQELYEPIKQEEIPDLSTFQKAYSHNTLVQLINLKKIIRNYFNCESFEYDFCLLAFASILEETSCMRKSGRALKIVREVMDYDVKKHYLTKLYSMINDLNYPLLNTPKVEILNYDIRNSSVLSQVKEKFNLIVFSPPYLNQFDYTEVYKLELWMLDYVKNQEEFKSLRRKTLRSHSSLKFDETNIYQKHDSKLIRQIAKFIDNADKKESFHRTIKGYIDDMYITLSNISNLSQNNAVIACVVGNSLFGSSKKNNFMPVATDLIISEIADDIGFEVIEIQKIRNLTRRGLSFPYGRESIIFMRSKVNSKYNVNVLKQTESK